MSVVTPAQVRVLAPDAPSVDADLQAVIDREESWLARRVGPLTGARTETLWVTDPFATIYLRRPTDAVSVTDGGAVVSNTDIRLLGNGTQVERIWGVWRAAPYGPLAITYTPNDQAEVAGVVIELVRLRLPDPGITQEQTGQYNVTRSESRPREELVRSLMPHEGAMTMHLRSSVSESRNTPLAWPW